MPHDGATHFVILEHPDNGALIRITNELDGISVDADRRGLIAALNLLDEKYPLDKIQGVDVDAFLLDLESSMGYDFFTPVTLGISIERAVSVHKLNQALTASVPLEVPCRLRRDINDPARLVIEILSGQTELA